MNDATMSTSAERIAVLERQHGRWRGISALLALSGLILLVVTGAVATQGRRVLEADEFKLRYPDGRSAASLELDHEGMPLFALYDRKEVIRASLHLTKDGQPWFNLVDENAEQKLVIRLEDDGSAFYGMGGKDGGRVLISAGPKATAYVETNAGDPKSRASAGLNVGQDGKASVVVVGRDGNTLFSAPAPPKP